MLNLKNWNAISWLLLLAWLVPSVLVNIPSFALQFAPQAPPATSPMAGGVTLVVSQNFAIGWPFHYLDVNMLSTNQTTKTYHSAFIVLNPLLIILTVGCLIYSVQTLIPRYSILTLFVLTTVIALILSYGGYVISNRLVGENIGYLLAIYFFPIYSAIIAFIFFHPNANPRIAE